MSQSAVDRNPLERLAEEFADRLRQGEHPSISEYVARYPELADDIRDLFPHIALVERYKPIEDDLGTSSPPPNPPPRRDIPEQLGDYRILRYLGEGGMGIVYEAVRETLRSHVALKVMHRRFRDREAYLCRFRTEARSAARLHHTNIVSVFDYGVHDGVCYYAMQYIAGHSLDRVLDDVRQLRKEKEESAEGSAVGATIGMDDRIGPDRSEIARGAARHQADLPTQTVTLGLLTGHWSKAPLSDGFHDGDIPPGSDRSVSTGGPVLDAEEFGRCAAQLAVEMGTTLADEIKGGPSASRAPRSDSSHARESEPSAPGGSSSTLAGRADARFYREVARLGVQVADALAHAHGRNVVHRDIKPPNLLLDSLGNIWITDFGLAKFQDGDDVSQSDGAVGTLHYMAPERFRGVTTAQCDLYALGATLYEMLTLRPAFEGKDQLQLIHRIENDPPVPPRQLEPGIPPDLEAIVLKALAKDPEDRFASAEKMAEQLRLFQQNRPLTIRPVPAYQRFWRWCQRDPGLAGASLTAAALVVVLAIVSSLYAWSYRKQLKKVEASEAHALAEYEKGQEKLFQAYHDRARAERFSRQVGQRFKSLAAIEEAVRIGRKLNLPPEKFESLRDEAIACMALPDLEPTGRVITLPPGFVRAAFEPTTTRYALRFHDGTISVRRFSDDQEIARFLARGDRDFWVFRFSPDGRYLASTDAPSQALTVWDVDRGAIALSHPGKIWRGARFSPDSRRIILCLEGKPLDYDLTTGRLVRTWPVEAGDLAFRPDGARIAFIYNGPNPPTCRIVDARSGRLLRTFGLRTGADWVAWSPDGNTLATTAHDSSTIDLWDTATGVRRATLEGHTNSNLSAGFHPAGALLASDGYEGRLRLWDPILGKGIFTLSGVSDAQFSRDGRIVLELGNKVTSYQVDPCLEYRTFAHASRERMDYGDASIRPDGWLLAVGTERGAVLWDLALGTELAFLPIGNAWHVRFDPSGDLITSGDIGVLRWPIRIDRTSGDLRLGPSHRLKLPGSHNEIDQDRSGRILAVANHGDAHVLTPDRSFVVGPLDDCRYVAVSPDGEWLATGSHVRGAQVWRITDGKKMADLPVDSATRVRFSPDGTWLMTSGAKCQLWKVGTWREPLQVGGSGDIFSPDGRSLVVVEPSRVIRLVEIATGRTLARLESPDLCGRSAMAFSPDGSRLVVTTDDGPAAHVWDLRRIRRRLAAMGLDWDAPPFPETDPAAETSETLSDIVLDLGPFRPESRSLLAQSKQLERSGDVAGAIAVLRQAIGMAPSDAVTHNDLAWLLVMAPGPNRNLDEALQHARRAVELEPVQGHLNTLGVILYRAGRFSEAIGTLEKSLAAGDGQLAAFDLFFLAMAHDRLNHREQARARLDQAKTWLEAHRTSLNPQYARELTEFRAEAEAVLAGAASELPDDVFAGPRR